MDFLPLKHPLLYYLRTVVHVGVLYWACSQHLVGFS
jgi:hypothetical protein